MKRSLMIAVSVGLAGFPTLAVAGQDCSRPATLGAALAHPDACSSAPKKPVGGRDRKKADEPGVYRNGNTTINIGGSVTTDTRVRAR